LEKAEKLLNKKGKTFKTFKLVIFSYDSVGISEDLL
jgi:hypothetical protein